VAVWAVWRLDARRRIGLWRMRIPILPAPPRLQAAAGLVLAAAALLVFAVAVAVLALVPAHVEADRVAVLAVAGAGVLALAQLTTATSVAGGRRVVAAPDVDLIQRLPAGTSSVFVARLPLRDALPLAAVLAVLLVPVSAGFAVVYGRPSTAARALLLLVAMFVAARCLGYAGSAASLRLLLRMPARLRGPFMLASGVAYPVAVAAVVVGVGSSVVSGMPAGWLDGTTPPAAHAAGLDLVRDLLFDPVAFPAAVGACVLLAAAGVLLLARVSAPLVLTDARDALAEGVPARLGRPFPAGVGAAMTDKDLRLLLRRGPAMWDFLVGSVDLLPGVAMVAVAASALRPSSAPGGEFVVPVAAAVLVAGFMAIADDNLAVLANTDADGPVLEVLKARPQVFARFLAARARRHAVVTYTTALAAVVLLGMAAGENLPPWSLLGLVVLAASVALVDAVALVVGTALFPAVYRPTVGLVEPEPQVRAVTLVALTVGATAGTPSLLLLGFVPFPAGAVGNLVVAVVAAVLVGGVGAAAGALARGGYARVREIKL
jgi:hypothetical protein